MDNKRDTKFGWFLITLLSIIALAVVNHQMIK